MSRTAIAELKALDHTSQEFPAQLYQWNAKYCTFYDNVEMTKEQFPVAYATKLKKLVVIQHVYRDKNQTLVAQVGATLGARNVNLADLSESGGSQDGDTALFNSKIGTNAALGTALTVLKGRLVYVFPRPISRSAVVKPFVGMDELEHLAPPSPVIFGVIKSIKDTHVTITILVYGSHFVSDTSLTIKVPIRSMMAFGSMSEFATEAQDLLSRAYRNLSTIGGHAEENVQFIIRENVTQTAYSYTVQKADTSGHSNIADFYDDVVNTKLDAVSGEAYRETVVNSFVVEYALGQAFSVAELDAAIASVRATKGLPDTLQDLSVLRTLLFGTPDPPRTPRPTLGAGATEAQLRAEIDELAGQLRQASIAAEQMRNELVEARARGDALARQIQQGGGTVTPTRPVARPPTRVSDLDVKIAELQQLIHTKARQLIALKRSGGDANAIAKIRAEITNAGAELDKLKTIKFG